MYLDTGFLVHPTRGKSHSTDNISAIAFGNPVLTIKVAWGSELFDDRF